MIETEAYRASELYELSGMENPPIEALDWLPWREFVSCSYTQCKKSYFLHLKYPIHPSQLITIINGELQEPLPSNFKIRSITMNSFKQHHKHHYNCEK